MSPRTVPAHETWAATQTYLQIVHNILTREADCFHVGNTVRVNKSTAVIYNGTLDSAPSIKYLCSVTRFISNNCKTFI